MVMAFSMVLVSCCVPSSGLLRYLPGASNFSDLARASGGDFIEVFNRLDVADWLFPEMSSVERGSWPNDPVIVGYFNRRLADHTPPYLAWVAPVIGWGVFTFSLWGALICLVTILLLLAFFMLIARIIAETGLVHGSLNVMLQRPWQVLCWLGFVRPISIETFYLTSILHKIRTTIFARRFRFTIRTRCDYRIRRFSDRGRWTTITPRIVGSGELDRGHDLGVAGSISCRLVRDAPTEYRYAYTVDQTQQPLNEWGSQRSPRAYVVNEAMSYSSGNYILPMTHQLIWWPLHPIGFLMVGTFPGNVLWFSVFVGWICKVLIVRFGGASMYARAKHFLSVF